MLEVVAICLSEGSQGLTEVTAVMMLGSLMYVGEDNECSVVVVEAEAVGCDFVDGSAELFHVDLEGFLPVELELESADFQRDHLLFGRAFCGCGNGVEQCCKSVLVDTFWATVGVTKDVVGDVGPDDGRDGFGGTFFRANGGLDGVVAVISFHLGFCSCFEMGLLVDVGLTFECSRFLGFEKDGFSGDAIGLMTVSELLPSLASLRMPSSGCMSL